jgi:hypothetical protein
MIYKTDIFINKTIQEIPENNCLQILTLEEIITYITQVCDLSNYSFDIHLPFHVKKIISNNIVYRYIITFNNKETIEFWIDIENPYKLWIENPYKLNNNLRSELDLTAYIRNKKLKELLI